MKTLIASTVCGTASFIYMAKFQFPLCFPLSIRWAGRICKAFTDASLSNVFDNSYAVYTLDYAAASANQSLTIQYRSLTLYD